MRVGVRASRYWHNQMLRSVIRAPISFFDATPSGQLTSRFGKELDTIDRALPDGVGSVLYCFLQIFSSGLALAGVVTPGMLVPLSFIAILYSRAMAKFRPAARDLKRCESKSRSPIYTHFREALRGVETIRSIPVGTSNWSMTHRKHTDRNLAVFYSVKALDRWLSIRLETLGNVVVLTAAIASVFLTNQKKMLPGSAGWGLTQALSITGLLTWAVRCLTDLETQMMSVVRVQEITDLSHDDEQDQHSSSSSTSNLALSSNMPRELEKAGSAFNTTLYGNQHKQPLLPPTPSQDTALKASGWPWKGGIEFRNVSMRYNPASPLVLQNIDIQIPPGSTLGVVGRSGSGKSSLLLTLFRLVELDDADGSNKGSIEIDGVDTRSVSLQTLRRSLSIIPQDPILFAGTIFYNLDATGQSTREEAWEALIKASPELAHQLRTNNEGLDTLLSEGGKNLSVGQRQLICLARALLRKAKILVLDEATSSVDTNTDRQVQDTIQREFVDRGVTVITVAHRLDTVMGYDKIAVLSNGKMEEYGSPSELLRVKDGLFRNMVDVYTRENKGQEQETKEVHQGDEVDVQLKVAAAKN